jgi:hypothetical protein
MRVTQKGLESFPERSGWSLKRTARRLFSAERSSILLEGFNEKVPGKTNSNRYQMSGLIGGSKLEFLIFIQLSNLKVSNEVKSPSASFELFDGYCSQFQDTAENLTANKRFINKVWS